MSFVVLSQVAKFLEENVGDGAADSPRPLWEGVKISVGPRCKHLCLFTQARWRNLALKRPSWFKLFGEFVSFLGGNGKEAARQLIAALSKDSGVEYDPAYAQRMEEWQAERLKKFGLFGSGESSSSTRSFPSPLRFPRLEPFYSLGSGFHVTSANIFPSPRAGWSDRRTRYFVNYQSMWGCRVDKKLKEDRKKNLKQLGVWGLRVDPKVIEARKTKLSASLRKFWDEPELGPACRLAVGKTLSEVRAGQRADVDQVWIVKGTMCPRCDTALEKDVLVSVLMARPDTKDARQIRAYFKCPCKTLEGKRSGPTYIHDAHVRAMIFSESEDLSDDHKTSMEDNIKAFMVREVARFNATGKAAADEASKEFNPYVIPAHYLADLGDNSRSAKSWKRKRAA